MCLRGHSWSRDVRSSHSCVVRPQPQDSPCTPGHSMMLVVVAALLAVLAAAAAVVVVLVVAHGDQEKSIFPMT